MTKRTASHTSPGGPGRPGGPGAHMFGEKAKNRKGTILRLISYLGKNKLVLIMLVVFVAVSSLSMVYGSTFQKSAIDAITIDSGRLHIDTEALFRSLLLLCVVYLFSILFNFLQGFLGASLSQKTVRSMRNDLFKKMSGLPVRYFDTHAHGDLMSRVTNDIDNVSTTLSQSITSLFSSAMTVAASFVMMLVYSPLMTLITLLGIPLSLLATRVVAKKTRFYFKKQQSSLGKLNGHIEEMVAGQKTVKAFNREQISINSFEAIHEALRDSSIKAQIFSGMVGPIMNVVNNITFVLVAISGGLLAFGDFGVTVGTISAFITLSRQFTRPINEIANQYNAIQSAVAGAERVFEVMDEESETDNGKIVMNPEEVTGHVEFEHVNFSYVPDKPVLKDFTLDVLPGQKIALVGPTGAGKTTVVNLITRFYDIDDGIIKLDGKNINDIRKHDLRRSIGIVLQDTVLFSGDIYDNIRFGRLDATEEEVEHAAMTANAHSFISRLPEGYKTVLSEEGSNLSQGQRQLLSIARAVLADPKILILDEATSSIDTRTEMNVQKAMISLMKGRTSFIIAHRLSTIRDADKILVINDGRIVESGNHEDLLKQKGAYYTLYKTQFANE